MPQFPPWSSSQRGQECVRTRFRATRGGKIGGKLGKSSKILQGTDLDQPEGESRPGGSDGDGKELEKGWKRGG